MKWRYKNESQLFIENLQISSFRWEVLREHLIPVLKHKIFYFASFIFLRLSKIFSKFHTGMRINKNGINSIIQSLNSRLIHVYIIWYECGITCMFIQYECLWHHCKFDLTVTFWRTTFQWITLDIYEHNLNDEQKFFIPDFGSHAWLTPFKVFWFVGV